MASSSNVESTMPCALIDAKLNFLYDEDPTWAAAASNIGAEYNIVSVLGSQGSGCTTLLNDTFGTQFVTMGMEAAQTTIGVQYAWSAESRAITLDLQGRTGAAFSRIENKLAQFAASVSSIILINLKQDEIVRHATQHQALLETICKTLLERYDDEDSLRRTVTLLYVIRDWDESISNESAIAALNRGITEVWSRVADEMESPEAQLTDYVRLAFDTLAHRKLDATAYFQQVSNLSQNLKTVGPDGFGATEQSSDVPLQDVFDHMQRVWRTIRGRVNVSDERRALAERMCPIFVNSSLKMANRYIKEKLDPDQGGEDFKAGSETARDTALAQYDVIVKVYDPEVVSKHRATLEANINSELMQSYFVHLQGLRKIALGEFKQRLSALQKSTFPNPPITPKELLVKMAQLQDDCVSVYRSLAESARLNTEWTFEEQVMTLNSSMDKLTAPIRQQQDAIELALKRSQEVIPRSMTPPVDVSSILTTSMNHVRILSSALNLWGSK
ncbi:SubName: Full=Uncharacterized protein {ECO:0000313/EMBL:CCA72996.1} [Serendipita indica DSM 11827]|uniref:Sey1/RHD3-like three-helix bundle domain-containing protein n=1 Tax=Serendipita indica (strain DSM 11827) TaxID=1109443 RepID=G4TNV3_SERID|nr:SubName: Full=Uncharacterized protein {ECO:0000313/EMBL:CCA72996.1} [Serendipita indica DSM 11827]CCA72996.1 hypothetical protein PIIN_06951 [Serendipita indica DSM 11827]